MPGETGLSENGCIADCHGIVCGVAGEAQPCNQTKQLIINNVN
jgi:hypothetical protein